jgi:hypothetical protein
MSYCCVCSHVLIYLSNLLLCSRPKGFGFIEFKDQRDADNALSGLDGSEFMGREIQVRARSQAAVVVKQQWALVNNIPAAITYCAPGTNLEGMLAMRFMLLLWHAQCVLCIVDGRSWKQSISTVCNGVSVTPTGCG